MRPIRAIIVAACVVLAVAAWAQEGGPLKYVWAEGLQARYTLAFKSSGKMTMDGKTKSWKASWTTQVSARVESANATGMATVSFKLGKTSGKQTIMPKGVTTFSIDPAMQEVEVTKGSGQPQSVELTGVQRQALTNGFLATMDSRGNVTSLSGASQLNALLGSLPSVGGLPDMAGLVGLIFPVLPEQAVGEGGKWEVVAPFPMLREQLRVKIKFPWMMAGEGDIDGRSCIKLMMKARILRQNGSTSAAENGGLAVGYQGLSMVANGWAALSEVDTLPVAGSYSLVEPGLMSVHVRGKARERGKEQDINQSFKLQGCASAVQFRRQQLD